MDRDDDEGDGGVGDRRSANAGDGGRPEAGKYGLRAGVALAPGLAQTRQVVAALVVRTTKRQE